MTDRCSPTGTDEMYVDFRDRADMFAISLESFAHTASRLEGSTNPEHLLMGSPGQQPPDLRNDLFRTTFWPSVTSNFNTAVITDFRQTPQERG